MTLLIAGFSHSLYSKLIKTNYLDQHTLKSKEIVKRKIEHRKRAKITRCINRLSYLQILQLQSSPLQIFTHFLKEQTEVWLLI